MTSDTHDADMQSRSGIDRRTLVRGAAATVWAVPAVTLVTATPAFAAVSAVMKATMSAPKYAAAGLDPRKVTFGLVITNQGSQPAQAVNFRLTIPNATAMHNAAPTFPTLAGYGAPVITGTNSTTPWTASYTRLTPLGVGASDTFADLPITFAVPVLTAPFYSLRGNGFTFSGTIGATNHNNNVPSGMIGDLVVAPTPACDITASGKNTSYDEFAGTCTFSLSSVYNAGASSIGQITAVLTVNRKQGTNQALDVAPKLTSWNNNHWTVVSQDATGPATGPWTWTLKTSAQGFSPSTGKPYGGDGATDGPGSQNSNEFWVRFTSTNGKKLFTLPWNNRGSITLSANHANTASVSF